jgi:hypothetical protein
MSRPLLQAVLLFSLSPFLSAQQPEQAPSAPASEPAIQATDPAADPQPSVVAERNQAIRDARTIHINSETAFLTVSTLERSLMKQKDWDKLGLNIIGGSGQGDLELQIDRVVFTHIHTYVLTDRASNVVLASGRVRAFDGVVASGPMAEEIVKILSAARLPAKAMSGE